MNNAKRSVNAGTNNLNEAGKIGRVLSMKNDKETRKEISSIHSSISSFYQQRFSEDLFYFRQRARGTR